MQRRNAAEKVRLDWLLLALAILAVLCLPIAIIESEWLPDATRLFWVVLWAGLLGIVMARSRMSDGLAWGLSGLLGTEYSAHFAARLLPSPGVFLGDLFRTLPWLWNLLVHRTLGNELPFARSFGHFVGRLQTTFFNISQWWTAARLGQTSEDTTMLKLLVGVLVWLIVWHAAYELVRRRRTFVALLPMGLAIVVNASVTRLGLGYVKFFLAITLVTLVYTNIDRMQRFWRRMGLDFSDELKRDSLLAGSFLSAAVLLIGLLIPYTTFNRAAYFFWDQAGPTLTRFYDRLDLVFAGRNPVPEPTPGGQVGNIAGHQLSGISELSDEVMLVVETSDPPPPSDEEMARMGRMEPSALGPKHYWRQRAFDVYTGHGWDTSERDTANYAAEERWATIDYPHKVLTQTFVLVNALEDVVYAANQPLQVDRDYRVITRDDEDLVGFSVEGEAYTVQSAIPQAMASDMQEAEGSYPDWVAERYLALPDIPDRVAEEAQRVVEESGATTRYEKARAIESYLRSFSYDLTVEPPPLDTDIVDYFLFTTQRGYCDYAASAMVVMLRSVGVAARYASGYGMGYYDYGRGAYLVKGDNAHAWPEVYFPGYGWIEFEPTPTEHTFSYGGLRGDSPLVPTPMTEAAEPEQGSLPTLWYAAGGLLLAVLFVIVWPPRWFKGRGPEPRDVVLRVYDRLVRRARWLALAPAGGQTPHEYLANLAEQVGNRAEFARGAADDLALISRLYQVARYSERAVSADESGRVQAAWRRLRGVFFRLLFVGTPERGMS